MRAALGIAGWIAACSGEPVEAPKPEVAPAAAPAPAGVRASVEAVGPIRFDTAPTRPALLGVMGAGYEAEDLPQKMGLRLKRGGQAQYEAWASTAGTSIKQLVIYDPEVRFPWDTRVGQRIGAHRHWGRMSCDLKGSPVPGTALCKAWAEPIFAYAVEGWAGDASKLPPKDTMADATIKALVWFPTSGAAQKQRAGGPSGG